KRGRSVRELVAASAEPGAGGEEVGLRGQGDVVVVAIPRDHIGVPALHRGTFDQHDPVRRSAREAANVHQGAKFEIASASGREQSRGKSRASTPESGSDGWSDEVRYRGGGHVVAHRERTVGPVGARIKTGEPEQGGGDKAAAGHLRATLRTYSGRD